MTKEEEEEAKLDEVVELLKPIVQKIESSVPTTKFHYGSYAAILSQMKDPQQRKNLAACLVIAGANKNGITWALKFC